MNSESNAKRILIVGPAWVGDMVMSQGLYRLLKQQNPNVVIDVLAPAWTFSILKCMPEINEAIPLPLQHGDLKLGVRYNIAQDLKARKYDQAIVLQNSFKSALIPWLADIPVRTGWRRECRYFLLNDIRKLDKQKYPLMVEQYLALGLPPGSDLPANYPLPLFHVDETAKNAVLARHSKIWRKGKPILAISAGAAFGTAKRWPEAYFAEVAKQKLAEGWDVWLFGSPKDKPVTDRIMALTDNQCQNLAGQNELAETIRLLSVANGLITNDSGLMHVAAALDKPLVAIYGPTSPAFTPPLSDKATVLKLDLDCQPCFKRDCPLKHHRCMRDILPGQILEAVAGWKNK